MVKVDEERVLHWLKNGAQPSATVKTLLKKQGIMYKFHLIRWGKSEEEMETALEEWRENRSDADAELLSDKEQKKAQIEAEERAYQEELEKKAKAEAGMAVPKKANCEPKRFIREFRTDGEDHGLEVGQELTVSTFEAGAKIDVIGTSKGRGTAGVMKRHNFHGQRASHGVKRVHRHGGSIGMSADPSRVLKGTRMGGRYGNAQITTRNLKIVRVLEDQNLLLVKGAIPGPNGGYLTIRPTNKR